MKKQLLAIAIVTMLLVATILGTVANAATTSSIAKEGDTVTVTINTDDEFTRGVLYVKFDTEHYDYDSVSYYDAEGKAVTVMGTNGNIAGDEVTFAPYNASAGIVKVVITFTEKDGATGEEVFTITEFGDTGKASIDEQLTGTDLTLSEAEPPVDENNTIEGNTATEGNTVTGGNTASGNTASGNTAGGNTASKGNTTNTPTELANTGAPIYVVGIAAVVVAAFVLIVKNAKR